VAELFRAVGLFRVITVIFSVITNGYVIEISNNPPYFFKAFPLHAMEALGGRGDIAPTHSRPRH
jgi:hypothetical protein